MHSLTPSIFSFSVFSAVVPHGLIEGQAPLLRLSFLDYPIHDCLARIWFSLASILSALVAFSFSLEDILRLLWVFLGTLACYVLGVLWQAS